MPKEKKLAIKRSPVSSSNVVSVGYDEATRTLDVEFYSGTLYRYFDVPPSIHEQMIKATSVGTFIHRYVAKVYRYQKLS